MSRTLTWKSVIRARQNCSLRSAKHGGRSVCFSEGTLHPKGMGRRQDHDFPFSTQVSRDCYRMEERSNAHREVSSCRHTAYGWRMLTAEMSDKVLHSFIY